MHSAGWWSRVFALLFVLGSLLGVVAAAEPTGKMWVIGYLEPVPSPSAWVGALRQGLRELGYLEGHNVRIEHEIASDPGELLSLAKKMATRNVDVIVTWTTPAALAVREATRKIPIVAITGDPVGAGLVESLSRPGGNVTGLSNLSPELEAKNLELLKEAVPALSHVAVLWNPANPIWSSLPSDLDAAAEALQVKIYMVTARNHTELADALASAVRQRVNGLLVVRDGLFVQYRKRVVEFATKNRLPTIFGVTEAAVDGGLMSYAANFQDLIRRTTGYVDRILKGAKPGELPIDQAAAFELVINLRTANQLGMTIPESLLLRADHVMR